MPYCVIALILKTSGAFLASDGAPLAGDGALTGDGSLPTTDNARARDLGDK